MKVRIRRYRRIEEGPSYWSSFVDIMSTTVLVFFFIMILAMGLLTIFVDDIASKREELYNKIDQKLETNNVDKNHIRFNRDEGKIEITTQTFFDTGKSILKQDGIEIAEMFNEIFYNLLSDKSIEEEIQYIEIVGHTDYLGTTIDNRNLSTQRAISFLNAIVPMDSDMENDFGGKFKASGMSEFETNRTPKERNRGEGEYDPDKFVGDRKIEVRMIFNNNDLENAIKERVKFKNK